MTDRLRQCCKRLRLGNLADFYDQVEYEDREQYLTEVLELALKHRRARRAQRLIKKAGFPVNKTLEGYDCSPITFPAGLDRDSLLSLAFIDRRENVLMLGAVGTGKTHLSIALGVKACMAGRQVKFYRAADLTNELLEKHPLGQAGRLIREIAKVDLFVLDELAYVPFSKKAAELLFNVISNSYEQQSIIVTSNLEFGRWTEVFGDDRLTAALVDRLVHHAHILAFKGQSYRLRQALDRRKEGNQEKKVVSGSV